MNRRMLNVWRTTGRVWLLLVAAALGLDFTQTAKADFVSAVQALNPLAYWRFETNTSNLAHNDGTGGAANDGTFGSSVTLAAGPSLPGLSGNAAHFPGGSDANSQITAPDTGFPTGSSARTFVGWLRTSDPTIADWREAFGYGKQNTVNQNCLVALNNGQAAFSQWGDSLNGTRSLNDGLWHFVALTIDTSSRCNLYFDGELEAWKTMTVNTVLESVRIGTFPNIKSWAGDIDEVALFTNVLSAVTIQSLYAAAVGRPLTLVWAKIPWFDSTLGNPYTDAKGAVWSVRSSNPGGVGWWGDPSPWNLYTNGLMGWDGAKWLGQTQVSGYPQSAPQNNAHRLASGYVSGVYRPALLSFTVPEAGVYSITGSVYFGHSNAGFYVGYYRGPGDTWTLLYSVGTTAGTYTNLGTVVALQNASLKKDDRLAFIISGADTLAKEVRFNNDTASPVQIRAAIPPKGTVIAIR